MPVLGGGYADTVNDVCVAVRALLNEQAGELFTNAYLLPHVNHAYRDFQRDLAAHGCKHREADTTITLSAGGTKLDLVGADPDEPLPSDFIFPHWLRERPSGSSEEYAPMEECPNGLPTRDRQSRLLEYEFIGGEIRFVGATSAVELRLRYEAGLPKLTQDTDGIRIGDAVDALAAKTAAYAARSRGVNTSQFEAEYEREKVAWIARYWRPKQRHPARRRPFGARRRFTSL